LEQSRLLNDIPKVIPEIDDTTLSQEGSPRIDKVEQNGLSELASGQTSNSVGHYSKHSGFAHSLNNRTDVAGLLCFSVFTSFLFLHIYIILNKCQTVNSIIRLMLLSVVFTLCLVSLTCYHDIHINTKLR